MTHRAAFRFSTPNASAIHAAVAPEEAGEEWGGRSAARMSLDADTLVLEVEAADLPALRASLNTWLRLVNVADEVCDLVRVQQGRDPDIYRMHLYDDGPK
jgi:KEOPS complex subunit Pcc1